MKEYNVKDPNFQILISWLADFISIKANELCDIGYHSKLFIPNLFQISMVWGMHKEELLCQLQDALTAGPMSESDLNLNEMIVKMKKSDDYFSEIMPHAFYFFLLKAHKDVEDYLSKNKYKNTSQY